MNFNKCSRCGCFFMTNSTVCPNCQEKDALEMHRLENYMQENENDNGSYNFDTIMSSTGISAKNLTRFLNQEQFSDFASHIQNKTQL